MATEEQLALIAGAGAAVAIGAYLATRPTQPPPPVPGAPLPPTDVAVSNLTPTSADVSWTASTGATGYSAFEGTQALPPTTTPGLHLSGLMPATPYQITVVASNDAGASDPSAPLAFTTPTGLTAPPTPTGLAAANVSDIACDLTWAASPGATAYTPYEGNAALAAVASPGAHISGLSPNTVYSFAVDASDSVGRSAPSAPITVRTAVASRFLFVPPSLDAPPSPPPDAEHISAHGADPTGTTDSGPAIRAAIAAAQARGPGKTVYLGPGIFLVTSPDPLLPSHNYIRVQGVPVIILGAGRDRTRLVGDNAVETHTLLGLAVDNSQVQHFTVDTTMAGGVALAVDKANHCHWQGMGACTGLDFGLRAVGTFSPTADPTNYSDGNSFDDLYQDGASASTLKAGWTADFDIDYQKNYVGTRYRHVGGAVAVYDSNNVSLSDLDYTHTARSTHNEAFGITRTQGCTLRKLTTHAGSVAFNLYHLGPPAPLTLINDHITIDTVVVEGGVAPCQLGDVQNLTVMNSQLGDIVINALQRCQGSFTGTTHGLVHNNAGPGAVVNVTGL